MFFLVCLKIITILLSIVGITFLIPVSVAIYYQEFSVIPFFVIPMVISIILMLAVNIPTRKNKFNMNVKQTFIIVALSWVFASLMGSIPLYCSNFFNSYIDALFESVSGFTTTGATVLPSVENLPHSLNIWRCLTHWIGGMGIVTLTVALLPLLGVGGFQLIKAEATGPEKGKVTARITTTAKILWAIYIGFTLIETVLLKIAGMDFVDALAHSLSSLGTGGFSSKNLSVGTYNSVSIDVICTVFMFLSGVNFSLFYYLFVRKINDIVTNSEVKAYIAIVFVATLIVTFSIIPIYGSFANALRYASFNIVSVITTTGFSTANYQQWPSIAQAVIFILFFIGGCSGSTAGGFKVIRWVILGKQFSNETRRMLHPHGVFTIQINKRVSRGDIVFSVTSFMSIYFIMVAITTLVGCLGNLDLGTAFSAALSMLGNIGLAFSKLGPDGNCSIVPQFVKLWYCFVMLAGRLELYTMIIFFMPSYWKD